MWQRLPRPSSRKLARSQDVRDLSEAVLRNTLEFNAAHFDVKRAGRGRAVSLRSPRAAAGALGALVYGRIEWDATAQAYKWRELILDESEPGAVWIDKPGGLSSPDMGGTNAEGLAVEQSGLAALPTGLRVRLESVAEDGGGVQWVFTIPHNQQSGPAAVGTANTSATGAAVDTWSVVGGAALGASLVALTRIAYDSAAHKLIAFFRSVQVDAAGFALSVSAETAVDLVTFSEVTMVVEVGVSATNLQYKTRTGYVLDPGAVSAWQNVLSAVCPAVT